MNNLLTALKNLLALLPFVLFALWNMKVNLKKPVRSKQIFMPVLALIYCVVLLILSDKVLGLVEKLLTAVPTWLNMLADWLRTVLSGKLAGLAAFVANLAAKIRNGMSNVGIFYVVFYAANALIMLAHIIVKRILITLMMPINRNGNVLYERAAGLFYEKDEDSGQMFLKDHIGQARTFLKTAYFAALVISCLAVACVAVLYQQQILTGMFYPVFGMIVIGEVCFVLGGLTRQEGDVDYEAEDVEQGESIDYRTLRPVLSKLFPDLLEAEDTLVTASGVHVQSNDELLSELAATDDRMLETYALFMRGKAADGMEIDQSYLNSGRELLEGKSILFNNPFYYDLIPYIFYPMNRTLLKRGKVLIVLGRHKTEDDVIQWCRDGFCSVTNIPTMWNIGVLGEDEKDLDVGILTRSCVHDLKLHEANRDFFAEVGFVVLMEPSKLLTTAQVGLNSIIRYCRLHEQNITYCSMDKNCDGLLDALSHVLMTSLVEVSATKRHTGTSSYMCWTPGEVYAQHRMLPNISRYIGFGTELSFAALKTGVNRADWYSGDAFPVTDIRWIAKQYYYPLLKYAGRSEAQESIDSYFRATPNMWSAKVEDDHYMTVEDEAYNMFEMHRAFSTRARKQGFINIIASEYLLKDYMAANNGIFSTDPKAIPYIVADYAHTRRNVALRVCLRMCVGYVTEAELERELLLIGADTADPVRSIWSALCSCYTSGETPRDEEGRELLIIPTKDSTLRFTSDVIEVKRRFSVELNRMESEYSISDETFASTVIGDLKNAEYIAEDENDAKQYLGTELLGHVFQKFLPGQFFTFDGKYYEMLHVTAQGQVVVRRAADHISGRPDYRQNRTYTLSNVTDSDVMGDRRDVAGLGIAKQFADIRIQTPGYWRMPEYNDFEHAYRTEINGIPERVYRNKQILRIELPSSASDAVRITLTLLFNEIFRTLFAENQGFICAVTPGEATIPLTYTLDGETAANCIYIIEDSQLDIGLIEAVDRNLVRILSIACDYLDWHLETLEKSLHPPVEPAPVSEPENDGNEGEPEKPKGIIRRIGAFLKKIFSAIGRFFKKIFTAIGNFFKKLFGKRKKPEPAAPEDAETPHADDTPSEETPADAPADETAEQPAADADETAEQPAADAAEPASERTAQNAEYPAQNDSLPPLMYRSPSRRALLRAESIGSAAENDTGDTIEFEPEQIVPQGVLKIARKPYHERFYLLYGGTAVPEPIAVPETLEFLKGLNLGNNPLKQARDGKDIADMIEQTFVPNKKGAHYCDFCGTELIGNEYERLKDGRERCLSCARTSVKTAEEFNALYKEVHHNLELFFNAKINAGITVQMVNAKKLHKRLKKSFVPTDNSDGRVLGVAIKEGGNYTILIENGAPRLRSVMTMAHEMTHIWQYLNWDAKTIKRKYGEQAELEIYEGMAMWAEIQYAYLIGEPEIAKREEIITRCRDDEYGRGFAKYLKAYDFCRNGSIYGHKTPFVDKNKPL